MYKFLIKYGTGVAFGVGALIAILFFATAISGINSMDGATTYEDLRFKSFFDLGMKATYLLFIITALVTVAFGIWHVITNPKGAMKGIIGLGILVVIFIIAYAMSSDEVSNTMREMAVSAKTGKFVSAGLTTMIILALGAVVIALVAELRGFFK